MTDSSNRVLFIYLDIAKGECSALARGIFLETQYSIATLQAEMDDLSSIVVYTNRPEDYRHLPVSIEDISGLVPEIISEYSYVYRAKPWVLLHALRKFGGTCVLLDSDTFILPGFMQAVREKTEDSAIFHEVYEAPSKPLECNSGVVGLRSGWGETIMEDALRIIDAVLPTENYHRTLEQSAIAEATWRNGIEAAAVAPWITHYFHRSRKRYMHFQIKRLLRAEGGSLRPMRHCIKLNPHRVKLFQYFHDTKTALLGHSEEGRFI